MNRAAPALARIFLLVIGLSCCVAMASVGQPAPVVLGGSDSGAEIFTDGFESGDLLAWPKARNTSSLSVTPMAAMSGTNFGLEVSVAGKVAWVQSSHLVETVYRVGFRFDPNTVTVQKNMAIDILRLFRGKQNHLRLGLEQIRKKRFRLLLFVRTNSGLFQFVGHSIIERGKASHIGIEWQAASGPGQFDGVVRLLKNGRVETQNLNLDNDLFNVTRVRMGAMNTAGAMRTGSMYYDEFESFRTLAP